MLKSLKKQSRWLIPFLLTSFYGTVSHARDVPFNGGGSFYTLKAPSLPPLPELPATKTEDGSTLIPPESSKRLTEFLYECEAYPAKAQDKINEQYEADMRYNQTERLAWENEEADGIPLWLAVVGIGGAGAAGVIVGVLVGMLSGRTIVVK